MKKLIVLMAMVACAAIAQPAIGTHVQQLYYDGSSNLQYMCDAPSNVATTTWSVAAGTLTSITVSSNVGTITMPNDHNLWVGAALWLSAPTTAGATRMYYVKTVPTSKTLTVTTTGLADGTYTAANVVLTTNSPLLSDQYWYVLVMHYNGSVLDGTYPGGGPLSLSYRAKCSDRALY